MDSTKAGSDFVLKEIQRIKDKLRNHSQPGVPVVINPQQQQQKPKELDQLILSKIKSGIAACMWCLKTHLIKKMSASFFKWKEITMLSILNHQMNSSMAVNNAVHVFRKYRDEHQQQSVNRSTDPWSQSIPPASDPLESITTKMIRHEIWNDPGMDSETKRRLLLALSVYIIDHHSTAPPTAVHSFQSPSTDGPPPSNPSMAPPPSYPEGSLPPSHPFPQQQHPEASLEVSYDQYPHFPTAREETYYVPSQRETPRSRWLKHQQTVLATIPFSDKRRISNRRRQSSIDPFNERNGRSRNQDFTPETQSVNSRHATKHRGRSLSNDRTHPLPPQTTNNDWNPRHDVSNPGPTSNFYYPFNDPQPHQDHPPYPHPGNRPAPPSHHSLHPSSSSSSHHHPHPTSTLLTTNNNPTRRSYDHNDETVEWVPRYRLATNSYLKKVRSFDHLHHIGIFFAGQQPTGTTDVWMGNRDLYHMGDEEAELVPPYRDPERESSNPMDPPFQDTEDTGFESSYTEQFDRIRQQQQQTNSSMGSKTKPTLPSDHKGFVLRNQVTGREILLKDDKDISQAILAITSSIASESQQKTTRATELENEGEGDPLSHVTLTDLQSGMEFDLSGDHLQHTLPRSEHVPPIEFPQDKDNGQLHHPYYDVLGQTLLPPARLSSSSTDHDPHHYPSGFDFNQLMNLANALPPSHYPSTHSSSHPMIPSPQYLSQSLLLPHPSSSSSRRNSLSSSPTKHRQFNETASQSSSMHHPMHSTQQVPSQRRRSRSSSTSRRSISSNASTTTTSYIDKAQKKLFYGSLDDPVADSKRSWMSMLRK